MTNAQYGRLTLGLIAAWFAFSFIASSQHLYVTQASNPPLPILLAVLVPVAAFFVWIGISPEFRRFVFSLDPRVLTLLHTWRIGGFTFLVLYTYGILPGSFALPAGLGDMAIGATAPLIALRLTGASHRAAFLRWQALGILDLVVAVSMGGLTSFLAPVGPRPFAMAVLPLSLIPTFAVPLLLILHIICIAQARSWNESSYSQVRPSLFPAI
jgi:hypothetical protein